jgi:phytoene/squalene synthetase
MGGIYAAILERVELRGYDVFTEVIRVPKIVRARIAVAIWARSQISAWQTALLTRS